MRCFVVLVFLFLNVTGLMKPSFLGGVKPVLEEHGLMKPTSDNLLKFLSNKRSLPPQQIGEDLPTSFDTRQAFPGCIHGVLDQGRCGSCWAFASSEVLSDRLCIDLKVNVTLSPQNLLECEKEHLGCLMGSMPEWAWGFLTYKVFLFFFFFFSLWVLSVNAFSLRLRISRKLEILLMLRNILTK